ncbi:MAG: 1-deoxy-D-xylulose-5-phosphate synthase [Bacteroidales bacterium]|nr:1-deoxy-D-xylulose-5-phosphate synthase [Bacteroidales bacterium]
MNTHRSVNSATFVMNLNSIRSPHDIKGLDLPQLRSLANDLRQLLLEKLSRHGGHIGPNLGMVEATLALHYVFDSPTDKIVFDVSHQSYVHKMLTGRMAAFLDPKQYDLVSGYTNPQESPHDFFTIGHTSTSISLATGLAVARDMRADHENIIAVIGDGALSGGLAFEGLDYAATLKTNFIVVVNDNDMSIAENHGGLYDNLRLLRQTNGTAPTNYFKALGFDYRFVADGNDLEQLIAAFSAVKDINHPVVVHIATEKGHGYLPAVENKEAFHYGPPFELLTGKPIIGEPSPAEEKDYGDVTTDILLGEMAVNPGLVAITAATPGAIGFTPEKRRQAGHHYIDVGIAEQEAVSLASGIAKGGGTPWIGIVSSFMQRAYDQLSQDVAINSTPVVLSIFHASFYGMTDVTHLGWFDIPLITSIPGFVYLAPTCRLEYESMLLWALHQREYPVAIKVPGGKMVDGEQTYPTDYSDINTYNVTQNGSDVAIIGAGTFYGLALKVAHILEEKGIMPTIINPRFLSGVDAPLLQSLEANHRLVVTLEDGVLQGGFGQRIAAFYGTSLMEVRSYGMDQEWADRYDYQLLGDLYRLNPKLIVEDILTLLCK